MDKHLSEQLTANLAALITEIMPDALAVEKYGGIVVERVPGQANTMACGYFVYAHHVSLEFSKGAQLHDPNGILEGSGKQRRHLKLRALEDIAARHCRDFLTQTSQM